MKDVTFKSFVIGELYIFIILVKIGSRANLENNFVYFLHDWDIERGESYGKYLFIIDESGDVEQVVRYQWGFFNLIIIVRMQQQGRRRM